MVIGLIVAYLLIGLVIGLAFMALDAPPMNAVGSVTVVFLCTLIWPLLLLVDGPSLLAKALRR